MQEVEKKLFQAASLLGRKGGQKTKENGADYRELGKKGAEKRWKAHRKVIHNRP